MCHSADGERRMNLFEVEEEASNAQKFQGYEHLYERSTFARRPSRGISERQAHFYPNTSRLPLINGT